MLHLKTRYQSQRLRSILSLLLAFAFIALSGVQLLHAHNDASLTDEDHTECIHPADHCVICEYIAHKQAQPAQLAYPPVVLITISDTNTLQRETIAGIYKSISHGFTNKAPPVISC